MSRTVVVIGILGYLLYSSLTRATDALMISFKNFSYAPGSFNSVSTGLKTTMVITNPTNVSATITGLNGVVFMNGDPVADLMAVNGFKIPANSETDVPVQIRLRNFDLLNRIIQLIKERNLPQLVVDYNVFTSAGTYKGREVISV